MQKMANLRSPEELTNPHQLYIYTLFNVSSSWLYTALPPVGLGGRAGGRAGGGGSPSSRVRLCLYGDRVAAYTVPLAQGLFFDSIKEAVAAQCSHVAASDIYKHFFLSVLDKDGDIFSSGHETVSAKIFQ
jgi:hypothetical protein